MNSPLPAYYEEPATETDQPNDIQTIEQDNGIAPEPYPKRSGRGFGTLPNVTLKQHRIAAIAGGVVTFFALGGFGILLAFAPREDRGVDVAMQPTAAAQPAATVPAAAEPVPMEQDETIPVRSVKTITTNSAGEMAAAKAEILAGVVAASAEPVPTAAAIEPEPSALAAAEPLDPTTTASVLPATSPRWGNSTNAAEEKAESLAGETVTAALSSSVARTLPGSDAATDAAPEAAAQDAQAAAPAPERETVAPAAEPAVVKPAQDNVSKPDTATTAAIAKPQPVSAATARPGRVVNKYVNLRSGPNDESKVLRVVPAKASLSVINCKSWCEVVYEGTRGYVYKEFVK